MTMQRPTDRFDRRLLIGAAAVVLLQLAMYEDGSYTGVSISDASMGLWGRPVPEYVEEAEA
jgi:hypothetical protein